jgi:hypothetical protein
VQLWVYGASTSYLSKAGVFDFEHRHRRQRPAQQDTEHHADNAAVTEEGHLLAGMVGQNAIQAGLDSIAKRLATFRIGNPAAFQVIQPGKALTPNFSCTWSQRSPVQSPKSTSRKSGRMTGFGAPLTNIGASVCWTRFIGLA